MQSNKCLNCEKVVEPRYSFCPFCGQKTSVHSLSFHELSHDAVHFVTHADKSIFGLLKHLAIRPGIVAREYIEGKRQKYFKPLNFFLIVAGLVVFMTTLFYVPNDKRSGQMIQAAAYTKDPIKKQQMLDMAERSKTVNKITGKYSNIINMFATPLITLFFWLFYKRQFNFVESLVANMYFVGLIMLFYAFVIVPLQHLFSSVGFWFILLFFLFEVIYRGFAYYQLANIKSKVQIFKAYGVSLLLTIIWGALTFTLISTYIRKGF